MIEIHYLNLIFIIVILLIHQLSMFYVIYKLIRLIKYECLKRQKLVELERVSKGYL